MFGVYVCIVTKDGFVMQKTSGDPSSIEARVIGIRRALNPNGTALGDLETFSQTSNALYNMLFSTQAEQALEGIDHIYVVSKGRLAALPFSVLSPSSEGQKTPKWLTQKFSFSYPAGLQHLMQKKKADKTSRPKLFIGIGDPYLQSANIEKTALGGGGISDYANLRSAGDAKVLTALPTLKFAKAELRSMSEAIQAKQTLILSGKQATEIDVMASPLEKADIIAFATHGVMAHELEGVGEAALVVSLPENTGDVSPMNDGLLTSSEIARLHLSADWVVLSACNTGTGENNGDDAFSGLASAFIYAGADNLLVSHWPVRDDAAAFLTVNTVKNTQDGLSKARALQKAMVDLMESDLPNANHPAVWAPFVLVGN